MNTNNNICNICHLSCGNMFSAKDHEAVLADVLGFKHFILGCICSWCSAMLKKINTFIQLLDGSEDIKSQITKTNNLLNLSVHKNEPIDIIPFNEVYLENCLSEETLCVDEYVNEDISTVIYNDNEQFEVKYLSIAEQKEEIMKRGTSEKYLNKEFKCKKCGLGFLTEDVFVEHERRHHETFGPHSCNICGIKFKSQSVLSQHSLSHSRRFVCKICKMAFKRKCHASTHCTKCGPYKCMAACGICKKIFDNTLSLQIHIKGVHENVNRNKYVCEYCEKKFNTKQKLTVHIRSHTGHKPFECDTCNKTFTTNSNLKSHLVTHTKNKTFFCVECNTSYKSEKTLKKHFKESKKHLKDSERSYSCSKCVRMFTSEQCLLSHLKQHFINFECDICNKNFSSKSNLNKHIRCIHDVIK